MDFEGSEALEKRVTQVLSSNANKTSTLLTKPTATGMTQVLSSNNSYVTSYCYISSYMCVLVLLYKALRHW